MASLRIKTACAIVLALFASPSQAVVLLNTNGFDSSAYTTGFLEGQDGWQIAGGGASTAFVQEAVSLSGSRSLEVFRGAGSTGIWYNLIGQAQSGRFVSIDWDMVVTPTEDEDPSVVGPFFGVQVVDDSNGILGGLEFPKLAAFGVDASSAEVLYQEADTGNLLSTSSFAVPNQWNHFRIELDFANDEYSAFLNGAEIVTGEGFVDRSAGIDRLTDADIVAFPGGNGASDDLEGLAYIDNFLIRDGLRADYNGNGIVDAGDYTVWRDNLGQQGLGVAGDGDSDGVVGVSDYELWRATFGQSNALPGLAQAVVAPEPASSLAFAWPVLTGLASLGRSRRARAG